MTAKFELVSPFQPAGDQPQAIEKLVQGFQEGRPCQTLLGATGTGKSLAWDEPVLVRRLRSDGQLVSSVEPIGPLIDAAFVRCARPEEGGTEVIAPAEPLEVLSFNPGTCVAE